MVCATAARCGATSACCIGADQMLTGGFAFVGAQGGRVRLRDIRVDKVLARALAVDGADELIAVQLAKYPQLMASFMISHCIAIYRRRAAAVG